MPCTTAITAQLRHRQLHGYAMPRARYVCRTSEIALEEVPCLTNRSAVKARRVGTIGAPPVVIKRDHRCALTLGIDRIDMPATPGKVWERSTRRTEEGGRNANLRHGRNKSGHDDLRDRDTLPHPRIISATARSLPKASTLPVSST